VDEAAPASCFRGALAVSESDAQRVGVGSSARRGRRRHARGNTAGKPAAPRAATMSELRDRIADSETATMTRRSETCARRGRPRMCSHPSRMTVESVSAAISPIARRRDAFMLGRSSKHTLTSGCGSRRKLSCQQKRLPIRRLRAPKLRLRLTTPPSTTHTSTKCRCEKTPDIT
jgi:hypothetical protein